MAEEKKNLEAEENPTAESADKTEQQPEKEVNQEKKESKKDKKKKEKEDAELNQLKAENEELKNKVLRQMAEFDNYKKRTAREKDDLYNFAKANCVEAVLGVVDNFERALQTECSDETFKQGVEMIFNQFNEVLKKLGVEEIEALGKPFDPEIHNAVNQMEDENFGENTVCQVFQKGYRLGDKVIRHAMVVVANP